MMVKNTGLKMMEKTLRLIKMMMINMEKSPRRNPKTMAKEQEMMKIQMMTLKTKNRNKNDSIFICSIFKYFHFFINTRLIKGEIILIFILNIFK